LICHARTCGAGQGDASSLIVAAFARAAGPLANHEPGNTKQKQRKIGWFGNWRAA
jgi:hypothetical protein